MNIRDVIDYNGGKGYSDGNNYWKRYTLPHFIYVALVLLILSVGIGFASLFACSAYGEMIDRTLFDSYLEFPLIVFLNILPCVLLTAFFWLVSGRAWVGFSVSSAVIFFLSAVNYYKLRLRMEPFTAKDISLVFEMTDIISNYTLELTGRIAFMILFFALGTALAAILARGRIPSKWVRIVGAILLLAIIIVLIFTLYSSDKVYQRAINLSKTLELDQWAFLDAYVSRGFVFPFLHTVHDSIVFPPEGYSKTETAAYLASLPEGGIAADKKVNVIAVMLEAYTDLSLFEEVPLTEPIYWPLHLLQEEGVYGSLVSNTFGGGTLDAERAFLTGYDSYDDYNKRIDSYVWFLKSQGYYTEGVHPGLSWFYNRKNVSEYLGFDNYYFLKELDGLDRDDYRFFSSIRRLYDERNTETPYFSFSVSFQNHGAYDAASTGEVSYIDKTALSESSYNILNNYLTGIADTNLRMYDFADGFRESDEPVVIVFFGDHMPLLGDGNSVYTELGINMDIGTEEGFYNYYSTPYLIWANDAAKAALGSDLMGEGDTISACFLMNQVFSLCGWDGPPFMQISNDLYSEGVSVINTAANLFRENGSVTDSLAPSAAEAYRKFSHAQHYSKNNYTY